MKEYVWISDAYRDMQVLKEKYTYLKNYQEQLKKDYNNWPGPPESFSKAIWEESINGQILFNREELKLKENKIKELRKIIKKLNREQNMIKNKKE